MRSTHPAMGLAMTAFLSGCVGKPPAPTPPLERANAPAIQPSEPTLPPARSDQVPPTTPTRQQPSRLENGLGVSIRRSSAGQDALLQLGVASGTLTQAPGLAELAAHVVVEGADPAQGRGSLRQTIQQLGGTLHIHLGTQSTWLDARVPADRWQEAAAALRSAVSTPTQSRSQVERIREHLLEHRAAAVLRDPVEVMAQQLLLGERGSAEPMQNLLDRDPSEVSLFHARCYRPERLVLVLEVPDPAEQVLAVVRKGGAVDFGGWTPTPAPGAAVPLDRAFESGVYWSTAASDTCSVALVMQLPAACVASAPLFVLQDCVTLDGTGGRLEQLQRERGLEQVRWRTSLVHGADAVALVLRAELSPTQAAVAWRTLQLARVSLRDVPLSASELALGRRRASLTARLGLLEGGSRLRTDVRLAALGESIRDIDTRLDALERAGTLVPEEAITTFLKLPVAMIAIGSKPPADLEGVRTFERLPAGYVTTPATTPTNAAVGKAAATPWLERAMDAVGGADVVRRLDGWTSTSRLEHEHAPTITETIVWHRDGTLQRRRELLGQTIETSLDGDAWFETLGDDRRALPTREVQLLRREQARHPLALLAAHARGELRFEVVAKRMVGDRDHIVLQAINEQFGRLRLHIDMESHLVRLIEVWDALPDGSIVHLEEAWSDYRRIGTLRAPFRRATDQDDGRNRLETTFSSWTPKLRRP